MLQFKSKRLRLSIVKWSFNKIEQKAMEEILHSLFVHVSRIVLFESFVSTFRLKRQKVVTIPSQLA